MFDCSMERMESKPLFENVLLVEDEPAHALLIQRALAQLATKVTTTNSAKAALAAIKAHNFDLVITDLHLPDTSGISHVSALQEQIREVPVVVLTASTSLRDAVQAMQAGARDFIVKDFGGSFKDVLTLALTRLAAARALEIERQKMQREMAVLRQAIENSNDALGVLDSAGNFAYYNSAMQRLADLCGGTTQSLITLFSGRVKDFATLQKNLENKFRELPAEAVWSTEIVLEGDEFRAFTVTLSVVQKLTDLAVLPPRQVVLWARDITEMKRREKFQREILSTTTHDLKGPLGAIAISAELLRELLAQGSKPYEIGLRIEASAQGALSLIDEFLSARRLKEGNFILKPTCHQIAALLDETSANYEAIARARKITLQHEYSSTVEGMVDKLGFQRVVGNLLSNALKFTPAGGMVILRATNELATPEAEGLLIEVQDTGSGMQPADVQRLFQRFSRLEQHKEIGGTGLGLFVVKSIVSAHGGKVEVTSQPSKGSIFKLFFPKRPPVNERGEVIALDFA